MREVAILHRGNDKVAMKIGGCSQRERLTPGAAWPDALIVCISSNPITASHSIVYLLVWVRVKFSRSSQIYCHSAISRSVLPRSMIALRDLLELFLLYSLSHLFGSELLRTHVYIPPRSSSPTRLTTVVLLLCPSCIFVCEPSYAYIQDFEVFKFIIWLCLPHTEVMFRERPEVRVE
jgi:hypothetical protein